MASSSAVQPKERYDVFISFRGPDTRKTFTSHLHAALIQRKVQTFIDYGIEKGDEVEHALPEAIKESKISVVVLSEHYASSKWCLDELAYIMELKEKYGRHVIPIFYETDPSHVRHQKGSYATAFDEHDTRSDNRMKVPTWKNSLKKVADLSGFDSTSNTVRDEYDLVQQVARDVLIKLNREYSSCDLTAGFVGMERRIQQIVLELNSIPAKDVRSVVIWGMGGIGKTTLADAVFHGLSSQFEGSCFLANVRERSGTKGAYSRDLYNLRDELLQALLGDKDLTSSTQTIHGLVKARLSRTKVLVVLDDVNDLSQLKFLAGQGIQFGQGSRVIITTRNRQHATDVKVAMIGTSHDVKTYEVEPLNCNEAHEFFSLNTPSEIQDSTEFIKRVIDYAAGIPLTLDTCLSLFLQCKSKEELVSLWNEMKRFPREGLLRAFRISYEALEENHKEVFLDIACFHKGKDLSEAKRVLDACGLSSDSGIKCLINMSLIKDKHGQIWMHDVIQEMGWEIVKENCLEEPGKRSRLFALEDVHHVLENTTGTAELQGIFAPWDDFDIDRRVKLSPQAFNNMHRLRFLQLGDCEVDFDRLESLPNFLRYVSWAYYPFKSLPLSSPNRLVELHLPSSKLHKLWSEEKSPQSLKRINLRNSKELVEVSGLSKCANLESIDLFGCSKLLQVPSHFQNLNSLTYLDLGYCNKIESLPEMPSKMEILDLGRTGIERLPSSIFESRNIKRLDLYGCSKLKQIPEIVEPMECLEYLDLRETGIEELPCSFGNLVGLKKLKLDLFSNLQVVYNLKHLEDLSILECKKLTKFPSSVILAL